MTPTDTIDLDRNPWPRAADYIDEHGWIKGAEVNEAGQVCAEGAVRLCAPQPGDGTIHREVLNHRHKGAEFNDAPGTTKDDVVRYLRIEAAPITDDELEQVFGPQWREVVALVRRAALLTDDERVAYNDACWALWNDTFSPFNAAWRAVVVHSGPGGAALRALRSFGLVLGAVVAYALARRHEIGQPGGITQEHYDALVGPWVERFGPVHDDDLAVAR